MSEETTLQTTTSQSWKPKALIVGGILGALIGVAAAYLFVQNARDEEKLGITAGEGVKLGVLVLGLLRSITTLGEGK